MSAACPSLAPLPLTFRGQRRATDGALDRPGETLGSLGHHTRNQRPRRRTPSRKACQHRIALCADGIGRKPGGDAERGISFAARLFSKKRRLPSSRSFVVYVHGINRLKWFHQFRRSKRSSVAALRRQQVQRRLSFRPARVCRSRSAALPTLLTRIDRQEKKKKKKKGKWNDNSSGSRSV